MDYVTERACRIYALAHGSGVPDDFDMPLYRLYAVLSFAKGTETTTEDVHNAWTAWAVTMHPNHRSAVPFDDLSPEVQRMDDAYVEAIHKAAAT